jgi:anti-anti-sigma factor
VRPVDVPEFAAVVSLRGEHDMVTAAEVLTTLRSIAGNLLIDLSGCDFIDSSVIGTLITVSRERERDGRYFELVVPRANLMVSRTLALIGLGDLVVIQEARPTSADSQT